MAAVAVVVVVVVVVAAVVVVVAVAVDIEANRKTRLVCAEFRLVLGKATRTLGIKAWSFFAPRSHVVSNSVKRYISEHRRSIGLHRDALVRGMA